MSSTSASSNPPPATSSSSLDPPLPPTAHSTTGPNKPSTPATTTTTTATPETAAQDDSRREPPAPASTAAELARTKISLYGALRHFADFPIPGIDFIDIMPLFLDPAIHATLLRCLELQVLHFSGAHGGASPDIIVGLDARGFLFGPSLALRVGAGFVPVRKKGKLPGPCVTAKFEKEYGADYFQVQEGAIRPGQKVLVVDDIIATGTLFCLLLLCYLLSAAIGSCPRR